MHRKPKMMTYKNLQITERDEDILRLMSVFNGRMFLTVLEKTIWHGYSNANRQARNRLTKFVKNGLMLVKKTGLMSPRSCYVLSEAGKEIVRTLFDVNIGTITLSMSSTPHTVLEMISYYWLYKLDKHPTRTIVGKWCKEHKHTPDLYYMKDNKLIYVEIERTVKGAGEYNSIFVNMTKDNVYKVLYIVESRKRVKQFAKRLPKSDKLMFVSIEDLIENAQNGKIGAISQKQAEQLEIK